MLVCYRGREVIITLHSGSLRNRNLNVVIGVCGHQKEKDIGHLGEVRLVKYKNLNVFEWVKSSATIYVSN